MASNHDLHRPLAGLRVLVTRERSQARALAAPLEARGATVSICPLITFSPPADWSPVDRALHALSGYDGIFFTSRNAVAFFLARAGDLGVPVERIGARPCFAVGPATAEALTSRSIPVQAVPATFQAEGLVELMRDADVAGKRFLFPRARKAREILPRFLEEEGAQVDLVAVYETRSAEENRACLLEQLRTHTIHLITFTSSSAVDAFDTLTRPEPDAAAWRRIPAACIGEITGREAARRGFASRILPDRSTVPDLVEAITRHLAKRANNPP